MKPALYLTSILAAASAFVGAEEVKEHKLFGIETIPTYNGRTQYVYLYGPNKRSRCEAIKACKALSGGHLASIPSADLLQYLAKYVKRGPAFVGSWEGNDYQGASISLYPGAAIAIANPELGDFICEVPLNACVEESSSSCTDSWTTSTSECSILTPTCTSWSESSESCEDSWESCTTSSTDSCPTSSSTETCMPCFSIETCESTTTETCTTPSSSPSSCTTSSCPMYFDNDCKTSSSSTLECEITMEPCHMLTTSDFCFSTSSSSYPCATSSSSEDCGMFFGCKNGDNVMNLIEEEVPVAPITPPAEEVYTSEESTELGEY